jgi:hypothetical protein
MFEMKELNRGSNKSYILDDCYYKSGTHTSCLHFFLQRFQNNVVVTSTLPINKTKIQTSNLQINTYLKNKRINTDSRKTSISTVSYNFSCQTKHSRSNFLRFSRFCLTSFCFVVNLLDFFRVDRRTPMSLLKTLVLRF